MHNIII